MRFETWFKNYYPIVIISLLGLYILFSILAPVLMRIGLEKPAKILYWIYSNFCHQYPFRSWFLFGEQAHYPLGVTDNLAFRPFSEMFLFEGETLEDSRKIIGNDFAGYKIAICQRDLAIYGSLFLFGIIFFFLGRRIDRIPIQLCILIGVFPIAADGTIQLLSSSTNIIPLIGHWESNPLIRSTTGALFGIFTAWYILPTLEVLLKKSDSSL